MAVIPGDPECLSKTLGQPCPLPSVHEPKTITVDDLANVFGNPDGSFSVSACLVNLGTIGIAGGDALLQCADAAGRWEDNWQNLASRGCNQAWRPIEGLVQALWAPAACDPEAKPADPRPTDLPTATAVAVTDAGTPKEPDEPTTVNANVPTALNSDDGDDGESHVNKSNKGKDDDDDDDDDDGKKNHNKSNSNKGGGGSSNNNNNNSNSCKKRAPGVGPFVILDNFGWFRAASCGM